MRSAFILAGFLVALAAGGASAGDANIGPVVDMSRPHVQPPYPSTAEVNGEQGTVEITLYVHRTGHVTRVRVSQSSGYPDLDNAAVEGVMGWHFLPARVKGRKVSAWKTIRIVFQLPPVPVSAPAAPK